MVLIVKGLCKGTGSLSKADVVTFISMLRSSKTPSYIRDVEPGKCTWMVTWLELEETLMIMSTS